MDISHQTIQKQQHKGHYNEDTVSQPYGATRVDQNIQPHNHLNTAYHQLYSNIKFKKVKKSLKCPKLFASYIFLLDVHFHSFVL